MTRSAWYYTMMAAERSGVFLAHQRRSVSNMSLIRRQSLSSFLLIGINHIMTYPGGKGNCFHKIINLQPPHDTYIEAFLGGGAVMRAKRPALRNIGIDRDPAALAMFVGTGLPLELWRGCSLKILKELDLSAFPGRILIYMDPPYLKETRSSQRDLYRYDLHTPDEHKALLDIANGLDCMVQISGYASDLYFRELSGWNVITFETMTRGGTMAQEYLWYNYPEPAELHDYRYLGDDYRERELIRLKVRRWVAGLERLPRLERLAILDAVQEAGLFVDTGISTEAAGHTATSAEADQQHRCPDCGLLFHGRDVQFDGHLSRFDELEKKASRRF